MDNKEPEKRNGFIRIPEEDWIKIEAVAEAWVGNLPFSAVHAFAKRWHFHLLTKMFMEDRTTFDSFLDKFEIEEDGTAGITSEALHLITQMDLLAGFQGLTDEEMNELHPQDKTPLPDAKFFEGLGLN